MAGCSVPGSLLRLMRLLKTILALLLLTAVSTRGSLAAEAALPAPSEPAAAAVAAHTSGEQHGLPSAAPDLFKSLPISNSMVMTWVVALLLIVFARIATQRIQEVPVGAQNFWEWLVESLHEFLAGIIGHHLVKKTFWFFATIFILILFENWAGLVPGVGTLFVKVDEVWTPLLRGANADLNMTFAMGMVFFALWLVWALQENGPRGFFLHIFGPKGDMTGFLKVLMMVIFFAAGIIEVVTILFRPVTLSFRLYGNIFAGENMLEAMSTLVQEPAWLKAVASVLVPIPFYFLEVLVGLVQALVFMLLTAVFTVLICQHDEEPGPAKAKPH